MVKQKIGDELLGVIVFVAVIWLVFLLSMILPFSLNAYGLRPRSAQGLIGIPLMPFLHGDWRHIVSNTTPLLVLLLLLAGSRANSGAIVIGIILLGGALLWGFGRPAIHVGASGLVFGLISFLIVSGLMEGRIGSFLIAILVGFLYGGTLFSGVLPNVGPKVSWDGHLTGAIAGALLAFALVRHKTAGSPTEETT